MQKLPRMEKLSVKTVTRRSVVPMVFLRLNKMGTLPLDARETATIPIPMGTVTLAEKMMLGISTQRHLRELRPGLTTPAMASGMN